MSTDTIQMIREAVREELAAAPVVPEFANLRYFKARFGITHPTLKRLADNGRVRRKKIGETVQAQALYRVSDVAEWFEGDEGVE